MKVAVNITGSFPRKLKLAAKNLPAGVAATDADIPDKGGEVVITLTAEATAPGAAQPFLLVLREIEGSGEYPVRYSMASTSEDNGVPQGYRQLLINSTDLLWLTVVPPPPPPAPPPLPLPASGK